MANTHVHNLGSFELTDVTLRDGLQMEAANIPTEQKLELYSSLASCGFKRLEITSFAHPKWIPQLSDSEALCDLIFQKKALGQQTMAFVPNERGLERLLRFPIPWVSTFIATSEAFTKKNTNLSISQCLGAIQKIVTTSHSESRQVRCYVSTAFGCPYEGDMPQKKTLSLLRKICELEPDEIALSDTIGVASPGRVRSLLTGLMGFYPVKQLAIHLHDTYALALANAHAAYTMGIRKFDGSTGGIGGCPYAKGASGNLASEELLYSFYRERFLKGFALDPILNVMHKLATMGLGLHSRLFQIVQRGGLLYGLQ